MMPVLRKNRSYPRKMHASNDKISGFFQQLAEHGPKVVLVSEDNQRNDCDNCHAAATIAPADAITPPAAAPIPHATRVAVPAKDLRDWLARDLVAPCDGGYRLSAAGHAWVRRQLASADAFQEQHQVRAVHDIEYERTVRPAIVDETESPLAWLASRKDKDGVPLLTPFQFQAGERLRADYYFAGLTARVTANWNPAASSRRSGGGNDMAALTDNVMAARQRVVRALASVGPELSGILVDVCCHLKGLEAAEKAEKWPQRSGKVVLQIALTRLARHYGLVSEVQLTDGLKRRLQHWGTDDYRPKAGAAAESSR